MKFYEEKTPLPYFYSGIDINKFKFYTVPKLLFDSAEYNILSTDSKVLYCIMLDKATLSQSHSTRFADENGRIYIMYSRDEMIKDIQKGKSTVSKLLTELEEVDLIERVPTKSTDRKNRIYVKNFSAKADDVRFLDGSFDVVKYSFYMLPKEIIGNPVYKHLSLASKILYMFLIDRARLSMMNSEEYSDEEGRVYVVYGLKSIMERMSCSKPKAIKLLTELEEGGLIERAVQSGYNTATKIYVLDFASGENVALASEPEKNVEILQGPKNLPPRSNIFTTEGMENPAFGDENRVKPTENVEILQSPEFLPPTANNFTTNGQNFYYQGPKNLPPRSNIFTTKVQNFYPNNTYYNNTYKSDLHQSDRDAAERASFRQDFFEKIELNLLTSINEEILSERVYDEISEGNTDPKDFGKRYNELYKECEEDARILSSLAGSVARFVEQAGEQVTLGSKVIDKGVLAEELLSIDSMTFEMARDKYLSVTTPIKNSGAYAVSIILDLIETGPLQLANITNQLS